MTWKRRLFGRVPLFLIYFMLVGALYTGSWYLAQAEHGGGETSSDPKREDARPQELVKEDLKALVKPIDLDLSATIESRTPREKGSQVTVETSLEPALQNYALKLLRRSRTLQAAVVVLKPFTGQVLTMANFDRQASGEPENLCLKANFPAASLFKIVSSAAVIEARGFTPGKMMTFRGMKHTLYRSQLKKGGGRYTTKISLRKAFSGSVNPVFGKIGIYDLGKGLLSEYSDRFLFNREIPFDLPLAQSSILVPEDDFGLAEIASGFNKKTRISPLHAALITAAIVNNGIMVEPWLVRRVTDESGKVLYRARLSRLGQPIGENTARQMRILMQDTVKNGTCRKAFRPLRRKKRFKGVELGAKTGTINDPNDQYKFDWITAYALPSQTEESIVATVLAVHGEKLGIRANDLARYIINYHFTH